MRKLLFAIAVIGVLGLCLPEQAAACDTCGCTGAKKATCSASAKKAGCPLQAALQTASLTEAQQKKVSVLRTAYRAELQKAKTCGCPKKAATIRTEAGQQFGTALLAALNADQRKIVQPALAKVGMASATCGASAKASSGCGAAATGCGGK